MRIQSNITSVIGQLQSVERQSTRAVSGAFDQRRWFRVARDVARERLALLAQPDQQSLVADFVNTVAVLALGPSMTWSMEASDSTAVNVSQVLQLQDSGLLWEWSNREKASQVGDLIAQWVENEKRKEYPRDYTADGRQLTNEELSQRIFNILFGPSTPDRAAAARSLIPRLQEYADRTQSSGRLDEETIDAWLNAVLEAWADRIEEDLPEAIAERLAGLFA